jgi:hypothetical protein
VSLFVGYEGFIDWWQDADDETGEQFEGCDDNAK